MAGVGTLLRWAAVLAAVTAAGCAPRPPEPPEVASGASEEAVLSQVEGEPVAEETLAIEDHPGLTFTIREFRHADAQTGALRSTWLLFDRNGFVGRGPGGVREAKARAYDLYYATMADHGTLPRSRAEGEYMDQLRTIYGADLNRLVEAYMRERQAAFAELEAGLITEEEAAGRIHESLAMLAGRSRVPARPADDGAPPAVARWRALQLMGLDYRQGLLADDPRRPRADMNCLSRRLANAQVGRACR